MIRIEVKNGQIHVAAPFALSAQLKSITGRAWSPGTKEWVYPATSTAAAAVDSACQPSYSCDSAFRGLRNSASNRALTLGGQVLALSETLKVRTKSFSHQTLGLTLIKYSDGVFLDWEMGTGKSKVVVDAVETLGLKRVLILCPRSVVSNWPKEFYRHGTPERRVLALDDGTVVARAKRAAAALSDNQDVVIVINYEAAWRSPLKELLLSQKWDLTVCDEIHRIKDPSGVASKFCYQLSKISARRVGLTGTPMPKDPLDLFGQMRFVDAGVFGLAYGLFRQRYAVMGGFKQKCVVGFRDLEDMKRKFYSVAHRVVKEEVLDLPPVMDVTRDIILGPEAAKTYQRIENSFLAELEAGTVTVTNALTELLRLQQVTGGHVRLDPTDDQDEGKMLSVGTEKRDALADILTDLPKDEAVVVFCVFHQDLEAIAMAARIADRTCSEVSGRRNELADWHGKKSTVLAVQIRAGGVGLDMTRARYAVYYSTGFSLGDYEQSRARLHRHGQARPVEYIHLVARGTVDERVYEALQQKANVVSAVVGSMRPIKETRPCPK